MPDDSIVEETRAARERLVARFGGDLDRLWRHIHEVEQTLKDRVVRREPKRPESFSHKVR